MPKETSNNVVLEISPMPEENHHIYKQKNMAIIRHRAPILDHIDKIERRCVDSDPTLNDIFLILGNESHFALMMFLILPFLQPIPLFGLSTPLGILIGIIAVLAYYDKPPWLPKRWANKKISAKNVKRIAVKAEKVFEKLAFLIHPRWKFLFDRPFRVVNMILICANGLFLALPLPIPFSNAFPAWMIFFQALAHLEDDGLFIVLSYLQTLLGIGYIVFICKGAGLGLEALGIGL